MSSTSEHTVNDVPPPQSVETEVLFSRNFSDKSNAVSRAIYLKKLIGGCFFIVIAIFTVFSIYWGALWKSPVRNIQGWVIDFDGGVVGQSVVQSLTTSSRFSKVTWTAVPASQFQGGLAQVANDVVEQKSWVAVAIHEGTSSRLQASYINPNATYNGTDAMTVYASEARNENAYRSLIRPSVQTSLAAISQSYATQAVGQIINSPNLQALLRTSPQTVVAPISYTIDNLRPFDQPVASAVTFVGLIYVLILSFFVVMIGYSAREAAGLNRHLTLRSLIITRFVSSFVAYFVVSLFYSLLTLAFQLDFTRKFGHGGFVIFWMLNWVGMLSVGLALEALITVLTPSFIPFFMILWIIVNVSVCILPIEVLPSIYRYGYAVPFYNVSHAVRCIVFATRNTLGENFAILIVWTVISCFTLPLLQWFVRSRAVIAETQRMNNETSEISVDGKLARRGV
ncbi:Nitrosoguanidine resistance protein SNG1 [Hypsizygus marmoreus]|uniref:Nitrosoguanidine resistance protein SNG1 n=1 Tax=Hypsizygus marmoreus TaxID=39966 RepID=A0A369JZG2_HYPMA|nr:Nitrosoguanidine resistance protein SNG1 [Hypsizygus marmoreus]